MKKDIKENVRYCRKCGAKNTGQKYCSSCGALIEDRTIDWGKEAELMKVRKKKPEKKRGENTGLSETLFWVGWFLAELTGIYAAFVCVTGLDSHLSFLEQYGVSGFLSAVNVAVGLQGLIGMSLVYLFRKRKIRYNAAVVLCGLTVLIMAALSVSYILLKSGKLIGNIRILLYGAALQYHSAGGHIIIAELIALVAMLTGKRVGMLQSK